MVSNSVSLFPRVPHSRRNPPPPADAKSPAITKKKAKDAKRRREMSGVENARSRTEAKKQRLLVWKKKRKAGREAERAEKKAAKAAAQAAKKAAKKAEREPRNPKRWTQKVHLSAFTASRLAHPRRSFVTTRASPPPVSSPFHTVFNDAMKEILLKGGPTQAGYDQVAKIMNDRCAADVHDGLERVFTGAHVYDMFRKILGKQTPTGNNSEYDDAEVARMQLMRQLEADVLGAAPIEVKSKPKAARHTGLAISSAAAGSHRRPIGGRSKDDVHPEQFSSRAAHGVASQNIASAVDAVTKLRETQLRAATRLQGAPKSGAFVARGVRRQCY